MSHPVVWCVLPASGIGSRFGAGLPKQYVQLDAGRCVLAHTLDRMTAVSEVAAVQVALRPDDTWWTPLIEAGDWPVEIRTTVGGEERCHSVLNALDALRPEASDDDWVLVHDAVRPCVRPADVRRLVSELCDDPVGGLLAVPVRDTMKRAGPDQRTDATVARDGLWHALTPQMFRFGLLERALRAARDAGRMPTDEAQAVELAGHRPRLVEGSPDNVKITGPDDLALARLILAAQMAHRETGDAVEERMGDQSVATPAGSRSGAER